MENGKELIRTYCPMSKSRCGVIATIENGQFVRPSPITPIVASASRASRRRRWFTIPCV